MYVTGTGSPYAGHNVTEAIKKTAREEAAKLQQEAEQGKTKFIKVHRLQPSNSKSGAGAYYATFDYEQMREVDQQIEEHFGGGLWRAVVYVDGKKKENWSFRTEGVPKDKEGRVIEEEQTEFLPSASGRNLSRGAAFNREHDHSLAIEEERMQLSRKITVLEEKLEKEQAERERLWKRNTELEILVKALEAEKVRIEANARHQIELASMKKGDGGDKLLAVMLQQMNQQQQAMWSFAMKDRAERDPLEQVERIMSLTDRVKENAEEPENGTLEKVLSALGPTLASLGAYLRAPQSAVPGPGVQGQGAPGLPAPPQVPHGFWTTERFAGLLDEGLNYEPDPSAWSEAAFAEISAEGRDFLAKHEGSEGLDQFATKIPRLDATTLIQVLNNPDYASAKHWLVNALANLKKRCLHAA